MDMCMEAYIRALERMTGTDMVSTEADAGFAVLEDGRDVQVFVRLAAFDKDLLQTRPETGGLLINE